MTTQSPAEGATTTSPQPEYESHHCANCGSQKFDASESCWHCVTAHRELLERLERGGDSAVGWEVVAGWAMLGVEREPGRRWRVG
jgi:hypothetical protein